MSLTFLSMIHFSLHNSPVIDRTSARTASIPRNNRANRMIVHVVLTNILIRPGSDLLPVSGSHRMVLKLEMIPSGEYQCSIVLFIQPPIWRASEPRKHLPSSRTPNYSFVPIKCLNLTKKWWHIVQKKATRLNDEHQRIRVVFMVKYIRQFFCLGCTKNGSGYFPPKGVFSLERRWCIWQLKCLLISWHWYLQCLVQVFRLECLLQTKRMTAKSCKIK